jgi:hypothetical protein
MLPVILKFSIILVIYMKKVGGLLEYASIMPGIVNDTTWSKSFW